MRTIRRFDFLHKIEFMFSEKYCTTCKSGNKIVLALLACCTLELNELARFKATKRILGEASIRYPQGFITYF